MSGYTTQDVARMIGVSSGRLRAYLRAGVLSPERGERGELRFSFQDLLLLRKAEGLVSQRIRPHRVRRALQKLRARLPETSPLTGVQLGTEGSSVVVQEGNTRWQVESGQVLLSFEPPPDAAPEAPLGMLRARPAIVAGSDVAPPSPEEIYEIGCDIDDADPAQAEASYRQVLMQAPEHADAHINLGRILHERGDMTAAEAHYRRALVIRPGDATALFNLGVALEDQGRNSAALDAYGRAIEADGRNADAHYNAARLYDLTGDYSAALRHLRICRDLTRTPR
ncbi:MAG TPA: tetratricopeptide repeat protein [Polyangia bacterium]|nr:tetratricopeptide repeat protein [Polyangia bacterium]